MQNTFRIFFFLDDCNRYYSKLYVVIFVFWQKLVTIQQFKNTNIPVSQLNYLLFIIIFRFVVSQDVHQGATARLVVCVSPAASLRVDHAMLQPVSRALCSAACH